MKKILAIMIFLVMFVVAISGCSENNTQKNTETSNDADLFIGHWEGTATASLWGTYNVSYTFYENGTFTSTSDFIDLETGEWEVKDSQLYVPVGAEIGLGYEFSNGNNRLTLSLLGDPYLTMDKIKPD